MSYAIEADSEDQAIEQINKDLEICRRLGVRSSIFCTDSTDYDTSVIHSMEVKTNA